MDHSSYRLKIRSLLLMLLVYLCSYSSAQGFTVAVERDPLKVGYSNSENTSQTFLIGEITGAGHAHIRMDTSLLEIDDIYFFRIQKRERQRVNKLPAHFSNY
jgi:hypothetical protein